MLIALVLASVIVPGLINRESGTAIDYSGLIDEVTDGRIDSIVVTNQTGDIRAEAIDGTKDRFDTFARFSPGRFPGGTLLRWPGMVAGMLYYSLRDRLG